MQSEHVRIGAGALVVYLDANGEEQAASVLDVGPDREVIETNDVPGVLRLEDLLAVGVYADEAEFHLDPNGTSGDRIMRDQGTENVEFEVIDDDE